MPKAKLKPTFGVKTSKQSNKVVPFENKENLRMDLLNTVTKNPEITLDEIKVTINKHLKNMSDTTRTNRFNDCKKLIEDVRAEVRRNLKAEKYRQYYTKNREAILERVRNYYRKNRKRILEQKKDYVSRNRTRINEYVRNYYKQNAEKINLRRRELSELKKLNSVKQIQKNNKRTKNK